MLETPLVLLLGIALKLTVGAGGVFTVTVALFELLDPPTPLHTIVYVCEVLRLPVVKLPAVALVPAQLPVPPLAVQLVALVELQVIVDELPLKILLGLADILAVGFGAVQLSPGITLPEIVLLGVQLSLALESKIL